MKKSFPLAPVASTEIIKAMHARNEYPSMDTLTDLMISISPLYIGDHTLPSLVPTIARIRKAHPDVPCLPVVDEKGCPQGIVDVCELADVLLEHFNKREDAWMCALPVRDCWTWEVSDPVEQHLRECGQKNYDAPVLLTRQGKYHGLLTRNTLRRILYDADLERARIENPLTQLPGNPAVTAYLDQVIEDPARCHALAYFDIDDFKSFNDAYGFTCGNRAILLLSNLVKQAGQMSSCFAAHIGGDDFFMGYACDSEALPAFENTCRGIMAEFARSSRELYRKCSPTQTGNQPGLREMAVSCGLLILDGTWRPNNGSEIAIAVADAKRASKQDNTGFYVARAVEEILWPEGRSE